MMKVLWIGLGGFVGTVARYAISVWTTMWLGTAFPYGTLVVNVVGSLLMGSVMWVCVNTTLLSTAARLALATGVLGGFTTYSAFNHETMGLLQQRGYVLAGLNLALTVVGCLAAGALGWAAARMLASSFQG